MNTPLLQILSATVQKIEGIRVSRHYSDAPNYKGPRNVSHDEAATILVQALGAFVLDWRRVEDGPPDGDVTVFLAIEDEPEIWIGYLGDENRWRNADAMPIKGRVYAFAQMPDAPKPDLLIGFAPRSTLPAPRSP